MFLTKIQYLLEGRGSVSFYPAFLNDTFNKYFSNIIEKLNLKKDTGTSFESRESCRMIKVEIGNEDFSLKSLLKIHLQMQLRVKNLSTGKASVSNDTPVSIMKKTIDAYCPNLTQIMNDCLKIICFLIY